MPHAHQVPLSQWPEGWLKLEMASVLARPEYVIMTDGEKRGDKLPVTRAEMVTHLRGHYAGWNSPGPRPWAPEPLTDNDGACKPRPVPSEPIVLVPLPWWSLAITDNVNKYRFKTGSDLQLAHEAHQGYIALARVLTNIAEQPTSGERMKDRGSAEQRVDDMIRAARHVLNVTIKVGRDLREARPSTLNELATSPAEAMIGMRRTGFNGMESGNYYLHPASGQVVLAKEFLQDGDVDVMLPTGVGKTYRVKELDPTPRTPYAVNR